MRLATFTSVVGLALVAACANAQITILQGPGNFQNDENVLFNDSSLLSEGTWVQGHTNQSNYIVDFNSTSELLAHGGQAKIDGKFGSFNDLSVSMNDPGLSMTSLIWNLDADADGFVTFNINHSGGVYTQTFALDKNGQNFFRINADAGTMSSISFLTDVGISDVKQVRLGAVPEPGTLVGLGLGAVALLRRRKKKA